MHSIKGRESIIESAADYLHDESKVQGGIPDELYFPESVSDVKQIISDAGSRNLPVHFIGARTGTTAGSNCTDNSIGVIFSKMNSILAVETTNDNRVVLRCEPGVSLNEIHEFLKDPSSYKQKIPGHELLNNKHYFFPPDPTEKSAQIGGMVATNASGARSFRYGPIRRHIASCSIVLSNGELLKVSRNQYCMTNDGFRLQTETGTILHIPPLTYKNPLTKNAAGYYSIPGMDMIDLLVGSEGTFGAFVELGLLLSNEPEIIAGLSFFPSRENAFAFVDNMRNNLSIVSLEYFDSSAIHFIDKYRQKFPERLPPFPQNMTTAVLWEWDNNVENFDNSMDSFEEELSINGSSLENTWSGMQGEELERLKEFRHALPEIINATVAFNKLSNSKIRKIGTDAAVPLSVFKKHLYEVIDLIEKSAIAHAVFGHIGDCHLHINLLPVSEAELSESLEIYKKVMNSAARAGGTVSAEHGIGKLKREYLSYIYDKDALNQMRITKKAFDPIGMFNREVLIE